MLHFLPRFLDKSSNPSLHTEVPQACTMPNQRVVNLAYFFPFSEMHFNEANSDLNAFTPHSKKGDRYLFNVYYVPTNVVGISHKFINEKIISPE